MTNPYAYQPPGERDEGAGSPPSWEQRWVGPAWGPSGAQPLAWGYQPIDPYEFALGARRTAFRHGVIALLLLPVGAAIGFFGILTLFFGIGAVFVFVALMCFLFAVPLALGSVIQLWRNPVEGRSRVLPMIPALLALAAVATYAVLVVIDVAAGRG